MPRSPRWTDQDLIAAVDVSTSFKQVCDRLGLWAGGGTYRTLERHMARLNLETTHLDHRERRERRKGRRRRWTDEEFAAAVRDSDSISEVARRLGYETSGGIHRFVKLHIVRLGLDTTHFTGQSWAKGKRFPGRRTRPLSEILVERSTYTCNAKPPATHLRGARGGSLRDLRAHRMAWSTGQARARPRQRGSHRQPAREPAYRVPELPRAHGDVLQIEPPA